MTATNHVLTGVLIASVVPNPVVGLPLALLSHFLLDALPHFGMDSHKTKSFLLYLAIDSGLAASILISVLFLDVNSELYLITGGILAASPDLMWLQPFLTELRGKKTKLKGFVRRFHSNIQWAETSRGWPVEIVWFVICGWMILQVA